MPKKKTDDTVWVSDTFQGHHSIYDYIDLDNMLKAIREAKEAEASGRWRDIKIVITDNYGCSTLEFHGRRPPETDREHENRLNLDEQRENCLRQQYEALKKKFEGK